MSWATAVGCVIVAVGIIASTISNKIQVTPILCGVGFIFVDMTGIL